MRLIFNDKTAKVKVLKNTNGAKAGTHLVIKVDGKRVHVGTPRYIKRIARKRYNVTL